MSNPIQLGVIGCGAIAQAVHLPALAKIPEIKIAAIAEPDATRRASASARAPGATAYASWQELIAHESLDAVLIASPTAAHADCAIAAFEADKHVYLEKPIGICMADATRVIHAWKATNRVGMAGFNYRYSPLYAALKREILSGRIGEIVAVRSVFSTTAAQVPAWKRSRKTGGGVLLDLGSHHVDLIPHLLNTRVQSVFATVQSIVTEDDTAALQMTMSNGVVSQSLFSLCAVEEDRIEIYGQRGKLVVDRYGSVEVAFSPALRSMPPAQKLKAALAPVARFPAMLRKALARGYEPSYVKAFSVFADAINGDAPATPDLADGYRSLEIIEAAERSAAERIAVELQASAKKLYAMEVG